MEIVHVYQKKRAEFGRQCNFSDRQAQLVVDITPDEALRNDYMFRNPCEISIQCAPEFSEHEVNTERHEVESRGMEHTEGGWPKDVDANEVEQTSRFRKKVEKDESYQQTFIELSKSVEHCIKQNNALDIYEEYFEEEEMDVATEAPSAKTVHVLRDPNNIKRNAASISWNPDGANKLAVAYSILDFQKAPAGVCLDSYIWDLENPTEPDMKLSPSSPLVCLEYNPKDVHVLAGGCYNGQLALWDTRKGHRPTETTPVEKSHRDPVYSVKWLQSKSGMDCFSCSSDGQVMWWDVRKLSEPVEVVQVDPSHTGKLQGGLCLEYESTMPTKFMIGTEFGTVVLGNRKAKNPADKLTNVYQAHHGPVYALERNPFYPKNFLTVGDWTARVWSEDVKESSIMWTKYHDTYLTGGCWSRTRPGVSFTIKADGSMDIWDFLFKQSEPALSLQVDDEPLQAIRVEESGRFVACGGKGGDVTILRLSDGLTSMQRNEKPFVSALFERETSREKILSARLRELKLKERRSSAKPPPQATENDEEGDPVANAEKAFWDVLEQEKQKREAREAKAKAASEKAASAQDTDGDDGNSPPADGEAAAAEEPASQ